MRLIDADRLKKELCRNAVLGNNGYTKYTKYLRELLVSTVIDMQPTVNEWIKVSVRLPEATDEEKTRLIRAMQVIAIVKEKGRVYTLACYYDFSKKKFSHPAYPLGEKYVKAIAWMPLPKPSYEER